jgi:hypothetical protein
MMPSMRRRSGEMVLPQMQRREIVAGAHQNVEGVELDLVIMLPVPGKCSATCHPQLHRIGTSVPGIFRLASSLGRNRYAETTKPS